MDLHTQVVRLYNMIFCAHIEPDLQQVRRIGCSLAENEAPSVLEQVFLYQLYKDFVVRKYALQLYSSQVFTPRCWCSQP